MRRTHICLVAALVLAGPRAVAARETPVTDRAAVIATLQRLMLTGEPRHNSHDEGLWLHRAVEDAFARNDVEIMRLAQRAATPLVPRVSRPVLPTTEHGVVEIQRIEALILPRPVTFTAEIFASVDGGEMIPLRGEFTRGGSIGHVLPSPARNPGLHHVKLQARIVYDGPEGTVPAPETRNLREVVYALYEPDGARNELRMFAQSPALASAQRFDPLLPDVPVGAWLNGLLTARRLKATSPEDWLTVHCDDRVLESGTLPRSGSICAVGSFNAGNFIGQLWFRTGRLELTDGAVKWHLDEPSFEGIRLLHGNVTELDTLSALPPLLEPTPAAWPTADLSVAPEDVTVVPLDGAVHVQAIVRNTGNATLRGGLIDIVTTSSGNRHAMRSFVRDIPAHGEVRIEAVLEFPATYGAVLVHALQVGDHAPAGFWMPDPTPDDTFAFRVVNPDRASKGYAEWIRAECGFVCRGY